MLNILITGASSGIGRAAAVRLAGEGHRVFAGVRKAADAEALAVIDHITPVIMDVTDAGQIAAAAETVAAAVGEAGLHGLVNNAGGGLAYPLELLPLQTFRDVLEVDTVGQLAVTQAFLPLLRVARGRVVMIGTIGTRFTPPFAGTLVGAKAALTALSDALRQELAPWGIPVVVVQPATIHSEAVGKLARDAEKALESFSAQGRALYGAAFQSMSSAAVERSAAGSSPDVAAQTISRVFRATRPRARYLTGKDSRLLATAGRLPAAVADALRRRVFKLPAPGSLAH